MNKKSLSYVLYHVVWWRMLFVVLFSLSVGPCVSPFHYSHTKNKGLLSLSCQWLWVLSFYPNNWCFSFRHILYTYIEKIKRDSNWMMWRNSFSFIFLHLYKCAKIFFIYICVEVRPAHTFDHLLLSLMKSSQFYVSPLFVFEGGRPLLLI